LPRLRKGECCFGVHKSRTIKRLFNHLRFLGVERDDEVEPGTLAMHTDDNGYFTNDKFEPDRMIDMLLNTIGDWVSVTPLLKSLPTRRSPTLFSTMWCSIDILETGSAGG
jgi:hypothetical protein